MTQKSCASNTFAWHDKDINANVIGKLIISICKIGMTLIIKRALASARTHSLSVEHITFGIDESLQMIDCVLWLGSVFFRLSIVVWVLLSGNRLIGWLTDFEFNSRTKELCACVPEFKVNNKLILLFFSCSLWFRCHFEKFSFAVCVCRCLSRLVQPWFCPVSLSPVWFDSMKQCKSLHEPIYNGDGLLVSCMCYLCKQAQTREKRNRRKNGPQDPHVYSQWAHKVYNDDVCLFITMHWTNRQAIDNRTSRKWESNWTNSKRQKGTQKKYRIQTHTTVGKNRREIAPIYHSMSLGVWK